MVVGSKTSSRYSYLSQPKEDIYLNTVLRSSVDACKRYLGDISKVPKESAASQKTSPCIMEVEFLPMRKNDISVVETLDTNRYFTSLFAKALRDYKPCVVFPDKNEMNLAIQTSFKDDKETRLSNIPKVLAELQEDPAADIGGLVILVNPGFNVEEWIEASHIPADSTRPMICINGALDRLRNGYYPGLFYPKLTSVTKSFYSKADQTFFVQPVACAGDRFRGYITREYPGKFALLVKDSVGYAQIAEYDELPKGMDMFNAVKRAS